MNYFKPSILVFSAICLFSSGLLAYSKSAESTYATTTSDFGWLPSIGLGFGYLDQSGHAESDGDNSTLEVFASFKYPESNWVADAGIGFQRQYFSDTGSVFLGIVTIAERYQINNTWSVGPMLDVFWGHGSEYGTSQAFIAMPGIVGAIDIKFKNDQMLKLGLKYTSELGQSGQTSNQIGLIATWAIGSANSQMRSHAMAKNY